ncbi:MAG: tetratricopeptide repeat protein [Xenococcus sp. MO_188.B8]|nr:tetratricopeptide repeat protein [Xenococcus sp. MO_188.B8]
MKTVLYNKVNPVPKSITRSQPSEKQLCYSIKETLAQGNYAVAIAIMNELLALHPNSAVYYNNRGLIYLHNNQLTEAIEDLTHALEINPNLDQAYNNRANCYAAQGDLIAAIADYDLSLEINPSNIRTWINQGITFRELGSFDLAIKNFDIALILGNSFREMIYAERGRAYHLRGDWNCAAADYRQALELLGDHNKLEDYRIKVSTWLDILLNPVLVEEF